MDFKLVANTIFSLDKIDGTTDEHGQMGRKLSNICRHGAY